MVGIDNEVWKEVPGFGGKYVISQIGVVKRLPTGFITKHKTVGTMPEKIINQSIDRQGYCRVHLSKGGKDKNWLLHRVMAITFIPNPENKPEVNHIDGNKANNHPSNLEWCTGKENKEHCVRMGLQKPFVGSKHGGAIVTESQVVEMRNLHKKGVRQTQICKMYNAKKSMVNAILARRTWRHVV